MSTPLENFKSTILRSCGHSHPRGEVWLGTALFEKLGMEDTADNHLRLADRLGHALACLPVCTEGSPAGPELGYRYFCLDDVTQAANLSEKPVVAAIDGPFQQMVNRIGLMQVFTSWMKDREALTRTYSLLAEEAMALVNGVLASSVAALILTDDLASEAGPLVRPSDLETLCTPFYTQVVRGARQKGIPVFLHSCGKLDRLVSLFRTWQIDGFAAIQSRTNDLAALHKAFDGNLMVMAGIELELLNSGVLDKEQGPELKGIMDTLGQDLILCSSCGLYDGRFYEQVQQIYLAVDTME